MLLHLATNDMPSTIISLTVIYPMSPWLSCCYSWTGRFTTVFTHRGFSNSGSRPKMWEPSDKSKTPILSSKYNEWKGFSTGTDTLRCTRPMWFVTMGCRQKSLRTTGHTTWYFHTVSYSDLLTCSSSCTEVPLPLPPPFLGERRGSNNVHPAKGHFSFLMLFTFISAIQYHIYLNERWGFFLKFGN